MKITCNHSSSSYGIPVILDDDGVPLDYQTGFKLVLKRLGWSHERCSQETGKGLQSIRFYSSGRALVPAEVLNVLKIALENKTKKH